MLRPPCACACAQHLGEQPQKILARLRIGRVKDYVEGAKPLVDPFKDDPARDPALRVITGWLLRWRPRTCSCTLWALSSVHRETV
jgi:hypothetical protein